MDTNALRLLIQQKLQDGRLPYDHIPRVWGGPSALEMCDGCDSAIGQDQLVIEGIALAGGRKPLQMHVKCFGIWDEERREPQEDDPREALEAAIARRKEVFALSDLAWTADGYTVKFRLGSVDVVRIAVKAGVFYDPRRMDTMLDGVRRAFRGLASTSDEQNATQS